MAKRKPKPAPQPMGDVRTSLAELKPDPRNARLHNPRNVGMLEQALKEVGAGRSIVIDENNVILAGNATVEAAGAAGLEGVRIVEARGDELVAVRRRGLTEDQKTRLALYDNRVAELADWDVAELDRLSRIHPDMLNSFFFSDELDEILKAGPAEGDAELTPEVPEVVTAKAGDIWELGVHRLMCGDSTNAQDVATLLDGCIPGLMVTDPPYGVEYAPEWRGEALSDGARRRTGKVEHDDRWDWTDAWLLFRGSVAYVYHGGLLSGPVGDTLVRSGFDIRAQIIWAKDRMALSRGAYHWQHEPCWYVVRKGATADRTGDRSQTTVWNIPARDDEGHGHGTQKPVECMARPIRNHRATDVYDPFMGSGTTLIACEQLRRRCFGMELSPKYCEVIVKRWETFAGKKAKQVA